MIAVYSAWLLVAGPKQMPPGCSSSCEGFKEPKQPKRDFVSNGWHRRRNQCGKLVEESSVNSTKGCLDDRVRKKKIKNTKQKKSNLK